MRKNALAGIGLLCLMGGAWAGETQPASMQCGTHEYPYEAFAYGIEGVTTIGYSLAPDGRLVDLSVKQSSGWRVLDEATLMNLAGCKMTRAPSAEAVGTPKSVEFVWTLNQPRSRQTLVPGSCRASDRIVGFQPFDKTASGSDGILVRAKVSPDGEARFVMAERGDTPLDVAALAVEYLRSCRFKLARGIDSPADDAIFGRVLLK